MDYKNVMKEAIALIKEMDPARTTPITQQEVNEMIDSTSRCANYSNTVAQSQIIDAHVSSIQNQWIRDLLKR